MIDFKWLRRTVEAEGFVCYSEIEISSDDWWPKPRDEVLGTCIERHRTEV